MARGGLDAIAKIGVELDRLSVQNANNELAKASKSAAKFNNNPIVAKNYTQPLGRITGAANEFTKSLEASNARVLAFGASAGALFAVQKGMQELVKTTVTLSRTFKEIELLMGATTKDFGKFQKDLFEIARTTGKTFSEVAESATEFARQGLKTEEAAKRISAAMTLSALSGMKAADATEALTAAVNTFNDSALDATTIVNKLAQADAKFAVSSEDLAEGIKRSAAAALDAKVSFAELGALITSLQQNTARGGSVIGNSLKSIFTRIQSPEVLNQLEKLGIAVRDTNGETLSAMVILKNYAKVYNGLGASTKAVTSELVAGKFQINALKSIMADLNSTVSVTNEAFNTISKSSNEATTRLAQLQNTTQGKLNATMASLKEFALQAGSQALVPAVENILGVINTAIGAFRIDDANSIGGKIGTGIYEGIGKVLSGPGLVLIGAILAKIGINLFKFLAESGKQFLNLNKAATEQAKIENIIQNILIRRPDILQQIAKGTMTTKDLEKALTGQIKMSNAELQLSVKLAQQLSQQMAMAGVMSKGIGGATGFLPTSSSGFVPAAKQERAGAAAGGYSAGDIKQANVKGVGKVTYNNNESVIKFPGFEQPAIMPPLHSEAGKNYQEKFMGVHGFNPYASFGFIPNFAAPRNLGKLSIKDIRKAKDLKIFTPEEEKRLDARGFSSYGTRNIQESGETLDPIDQGIQKKLYSDSVWDIRKERIEAKTDAARRASLKTHVGSKVGLLSLLPLQGSVKGPQKTKADMAGLSALKGQYRELGFNNNATLDMEGVLIADAQKVIPYEEGDTNVNNQFGRDLNKALLKPIMDLSAGYFDKFQKAVHLSDSELKKRLKGSFKNKRIIPDAVEAGLFEQIIRVAAEPSNFLKKKGSSSDKAPFDFTSGVSSLREFFGLPSATKVVDIKRDAIGDISQAVPKAVNHWSSKTAPSIGAGFDDILEASGFGKGLTRLGEAAAKESGDAPRALPIGRKDKTKKAAFGFIPNFDIKRRLGESIAREKRAGVSGRDVRVGFDKRLKSSGGIGVFNKGEGSLQNAIDMHMSLGKNSAEIQKQGRQASAGYIPNFATELTATQQENLARLGGGVRQKGARKNLAGPELKQFLNSFRRITKTVEAGYVPLSKLRERTEALANKFNLSTTSVGKAISSIEKLDASVAKTADSTEDLKKQKDDENQTSQASSNKLIGLSMAAGVLSPMLASVGEKALNTESAFGKAAAATARTTTEMIALVSTMAILKSTMMEFSVFQKLSGIGGMQVFGKGGALKTAGSKIAGGVRSVGRGIAGAASRVGGLFGAGKAAGGAAAAKGAGAAGAAGMTVGAVASTAAVAGVAVLGAVKLMDALSDIDLENQNKAATDALDKTKKMTEGLKKAADAMNKLAAGTEDLSKAETARLRSQLAQAVNEAGLSKKEKQQVRGFLEKGELEKAGEIIEGQITKVNLRQTAQESRLRFGQDSQMKFQERDDLNAADIENMRMLVSTAITKDGQTFATFLNENKNLQKDLDKFVRSIDEAPERGFFSTGAGDTATLLTSLNEATKDQFKDGESPFALLEKVLVDNQQGFFNRFERIGETAGSSAEFENLGKAGDLISDFIQEMIDGASSFGDSIKEGEKRRNEQLKRGKEVLESLVRESTARQRLIGQLQSNLKVEQILEKGRLKANEIANKSMITMFSKTAGKLSTAVLEFEKNIQQIDFSAAQQRKSLADQAGLDNQKLFNDFFAKQLEKLEDPKNLADLGVDPDKFRKQLRELEQVFQNADVETLNTGLRNFLDKSTSEALKTELRALADAAEENRIKFHQNTAEVSANVAVQKQLENINRKAQVEQTLQQRRLEFGAGAAMAPTTTISNFRKARGDVYFGRQSGDVERETKGLVEQAKALKGLRLGLVNPAETLMQPVQERFEKNLTAFAKEAVGGRALTEDEKKSIQLAAKEQMEALIEPEKTQKETNKRLKETEIALNKLNESVAQLTTQLQNPEGSGATPPTGDSKMPPASDLRPQSYSETSPDDIAAGQALIQQKGQEHQAKLMEMARQQELNNNAGQPQNLMSDNRGRGMTEAELAANNPMLAGGSVEVVPKRQREQETKSEGDPNKGKIPNIFDEFGKTGNIFASATTVFGQSVAKFNAMHEQAVREGTQGPRSNITDPADAAGKILGENLLEALRNRLGIKKSVPYDETFGPDAGEPLAPGAPYTPKMGRKGSAGNPKVESDAAPAPLSAVEKIQQISQNIGQMLQSVTVVPQPPPPNQTTQQMLRAVNPLYEGTAPAPVAPVAPAVQPNQSLLNRYHGLNRERFRDKASGGAGLINLINPASSANFFESMLGSTGLYGSMFGTENVPGLYAGDDAQDRLQKIIEELKSIREEEKKQGVKSRDLTSLTFKSMGLERLGKAGTRSSGGLNKQIRELNSLLKGEGPSLTPDKSKIKKIKPPPYVPKPGRGPGTNIRGASLDLPTKMEVALSGMKDLADAGLQRGSIFTHDINTESALLLTASKVEQLSNSIAQFVSNPNFGPNAAAVLPLSAGGPKDIVQKQIEEAKGIKDTLEKQGGKAKVKKQINEATGAETVIMPDGSTATVRGGQNPDGSFNIDRGEGYKPHTYNPETKKFEPAPDDGTADKKDDERKKAEANIQAKTRAVAMEEEFKKYIKGISKSFETKAAKSIKGSVGGQITEEYAALANKLAGSFDLAQGAVSDNERSVGRFAEALNNAKAAGVDLAILNDERTKFLEELKGKEHDLTEVRQLAIRGINKLETEELKKRYRQVEEDFDKNLLDTAGKRAAAQDLLNKRLERGQATLADITRVIDAEMSYNLNSFMGDLSQGLLDVTATFKSGTKDAIFAAVRGTSTLKEAFGTVFQSIADRLLKQSIDSAVDAAFSGMRSAFFGAEGGFVKGYNSGGMVSGGSGYKDDVPAMLTRGEYVMRKSAVNKYGEGFFQKLNTGGMAKEVRTARSADIRLLNEYIYNDPKRPTSGRFNEDQRLSAFGRRNEDDRRNAFKFERERALKDYIKARDEHYAEQDKIQQQFKDQLKARRRSAIIGAGLSLGTSAAFNMYQGKDMFGRKGDFVNPFGQEGKRLRAWNQAMPGNQNLRRWQAAGYSSQREAFESNDPIFTGNATGGFTSRDNVPAMLMGGEYVVNKDTVNRYGKNFFDQLNSGRVRGYAEGGLVGGTGGVGSGLSGDTNIAITVNVEGGANAVSKESSETEETRSGDQQAKEFTNSIKIAVLNEITKQKRPGGMLYKS